jgi:hypothetical protein
MLDSKHMWMILNRNPVLCCASIKNILILQFWLKHIWIFTDHRCLIQTLGNNSVNRCLETSDRWQLQKNLAEDRRIKMNQTSRDVQNSLVHLHLVHTKNDIDSLAFQDDKCHIPEFPFRNVNHFPQKFKFSK